MPNSADLYVLSGCRECGCVRQSLDSRPVIEVPLSQFDQLRYASPGLRMLVDQIGAVPSEGVTLWLTDISTAIGQIRADILQLESEGVQDFDPLQQRLDGVAPWRRHEGLRHSFLYLGVTDPDRDASGKLTSAEVLLLLRVILEVTDWGAEQFADRAMLLVANTTSIQD